MSFRMGRACAADSRRRMRGVTDKDGVRGGDMVYDASSVVLCNLILIPFVLPHECVARCIQRNYRGYATPDLMRDAMYMIIVHVSK